MWYLFVYLFLNKWTVGVLVASVIWIKREYWIIVCKTAKRDAIGLIVLVRIRLSLLRYKRQDASLASLFKERVRRHPDKALFLYEDERWTFRDVDNFSNQVANYFTDLGYRPGDEVSLFMESRPEYVAIWLGLSKIGVIPALVNTSLRSGALAASIGVVSQTKALIYGSELGLAVKESLPAIQQKDLSLDYFAYCTEPSEGDLQVPNARDLKVELTGVSTAEPSFKAGFFDKLLYIYTSGTTGLPKAAIIRQSRYIMLSQPNLMPGISGREQVVYVCMPLYHTLGGGVGVGLGLVHGHTVVLRRKFSPRHFWEDCAKHECTMFLYVGEVCRYLLAGAESSADRAHKVRIMLGVGLRANIWSEFTKRFGVTKVLEFYGSTEGNFQIANLTNKEGACGFIPQIPPNFLSRVIFPCCLVKVDQETGDPLRDRNGLCVPCLPEEVGQFVVRIVTGDPIRAFDGYIDPEATKKKILRDVEFKGDACFMTGDLVVMDKLGFIYFKDRIGDTFRWKSENVSTTEVESTLMKCLKLGDAVAYGVEVPGCEGRAGMVAVVSQPGQVLHSKSLYEGIVNELPAFAIPVFVRFIEQVDLTGTYKFNKVALKRVAYNPDETKDPIYYLDTRSKTYCRLTKDLYEDILNGQIRF